VHLTFFVPITIAGGGAMLWYGVGRLALPARSPARATTAVNAD
jgi:hypothetical protein